jgi:hypothetical protein
MTAVLHRTDTGKLVDVQLSNDAMEALNKYAEATDNLVGRQLDVQFSKGNQQVVSALTVLDRNESIAAACTTIRKFLDALSNPSTKSAAAFLANPPFDYSKVVAVDKLEAANTLHRVSMSDCRAQSMRVLQATKDDVTISVEQECFIEQPPQRLWFFVVRNGKIEDIKAGN